jgi:hypothetical protein
MAEIAENLEEAGEDTYRPEELSLYDVHRQPRPQVPQGLATRRQSRCRIVLSFLLAIPIAVYLSFHVVLGPILPEQEPSLSARSER